MATLSIDKGCQFVDTTIVTVPVHNRSVRLQPASAECDRASELEENENELSDNPVVSETNDGYLSDIRSRRTTSDDVFMAVNNAKEGPVEEEEGAACNRRKCVFGEGRHRASSHRLPPSLGDYTAGVLVQTNFGGNLMIAEVPVAKELGQF